MKVLDAKIAARRWAEEEAAKIPGFFGAFFHGSVNDLAEDAVLPAASDVDVMVALTDPEPPNKPGKFLYEGALLEVSYIPLDRIRTPEMILGQYRIAGSFRKPGVILDPWGTLTRLQNVVAREFAKRPWVVRRCEDAANNSRNCLQSLDPAAPFHDQVNTWLFGTGITTHVLLAAGLRNPTVRRRYAAVRDLLVEYGLPAFHETLLEMLGCGGMSPSDVEQHLGALAEAFDAAKTEIKTPFFFASDISDAARPIAIDGSMEMIDAGCHREAVFWIAATYCRCLKILFSDSPVEMYERFEAGFRRLVGDLGIVSFSDIRERCAQVNAFLPQVWDTAETILAANPGIEEESEP